MLRLGFIFLMLIFCFTACEYPTANENLSRDSFTYIEGLQIPDNKWLQDSTTFWLEDEEGYQEIEAKDTSRFSEFTILLSYFIDLGGDLRIRRVIEFDKSMHSKIEEGDIYIKKLNKDFQSELHIVYNFESKKYHTSLLDTNGTPEKMRSNRLRADSIMASADEEGSYLCGTAYFGLLYKGVPQFPIAKDISNDSAFSIARLWVMEALENTDEP